MHIVILGAGPAGMIAALWIQRNLPQAEVTILDKKAIREITVPEISHAFFVHEDLGSALGVPLRKVRVSESIISEHHPAYWANLYSQSTIGVLTENVLWEIAPAKFRTRIAYMSETLLAGLYEQLNPSRVKVFGDVSLSGIHLDDKLVSTDVMELEYTYLISTIPLPVMLRLADWGHSLKLETAPLASRSWDLHQDPRFNKVAQIFFNPEATLGYTRFSNVFGRIVWECPRSVTGEAPKMPASFFPTGYEELSMEPSISRSLPLRFIPINEREVDSEIFKLTRKHGVLQLGRYATWRYKRVDHLPRDMDRLIEFIQKEGV